MHVERLWLHDFRSYHEVEVGFAPGLTAIVGANAAGKSNLVEGLAFLATLSSFRGAPNESMIRVGASKAVIRAEAVREARSLLVEAELGGGRARVQVNRQKLARSRDLLGALRVTVFCPDDLELVKGGPGERRRYLDELLVAMHPRNDRLLGDLDRILRQRGALLRQAGGRLTAEVESTLDVWDERLAIAGEELAAARSAVVEALAALLGEAYRAVSGGPEPVVARYEPEWRQRGLRQALAEARGVDLRRGVSTVGPHRDEVELAIRGMPARSQASQGEQRCLAFALRIAGHLLVADAAGSPPVLLLDDVFSELDPARAHALVEALPSGQTVLTTAGGLPPGASPDLVLHISGGAVTVAGSGWGDLG